MLERWKRVFKGKGVRVNIELQKKLELLYDKKAYVSKVDPCCVFSEWVARNYLVCNMSEVGSVLLLRCA